MPLATQITNTPSTITPLSFAITAVSYTSSTATFTATGHTFNIGDTVINSDLVPAGYNGTFVITAIVAGSTYTVANTTNLPVTTSTGTAWQAPTDFTASDNTVVYVTDTTDPAGITTFYQGSAPTALEVGDIWYDSSNNNAEHRWNGSSWVDVTHTSIATALANAATALANATTAYNAALASLQPSANTIVNLSNQITSINANGISVYAGTLGGAHVILNSGGLVGYDSSGVITTVIDASTGILHMTGGIITNGSITGTTLNVAGQFIVDGAGNMTANSATLTGTIYSSSGHIGGWTISGSQLQGAGGAYLDSSTGTILAYGLISTLANMNANGSITAGTSLNGATLVTSGSANVGGNLNVSTVSLYNSGTDVPVYWRSSNGRLYANTSSKRYKDNIIPVHDSWILDSILKLQPVSFTYKPEFTETPDAIQFGLIAEDVDAIPELKAMVVYDEEGNPHGIAYDKLAIFLISAFKELTAKVKQLEGEIR